MKLADLAICVFVCSARCFAQFESLEEKENAKDKLDNFFVQADELSESYAVAFRQQTVLIHEPTGSIHSGSAGGITIESSKYKLRYYCYEFDSIGQNPPLPHRSESFLVGGLERRRSSVPLSGFDSLRKPRTVLPDPVSGMRAAVDSSSFGLLAQEIDPFGLVLAGAYCTRGRNSDLRKVLNTWITRLELKSETESNGRVLSQWNGFGKAEKAVGRREMIFDSRFGYLPTSLRIFLVDRDGKNPATFEIKTAWEKYGTDQWRQSQIVVSGPQGNEWVEDTFDFAWAAPEELKAFLATNDWNEIIKNDHTDWYKIFSGFVGSQPAYKEKPKAK